MNRAIFLDRDGTINVDTEYLNKPEDVKLLPLVIDGLKRIQSYGFQLVIITNQSGVGRGYFTEKQLHLIHNRLLSILKKESIYIEKIYYAPYYKKSNIKKYQQDAHLRKPNTGMLIRASQELNIELTASYMVGDKDSDIGAGINSGLKGNVLIRSRYPYKRKEYVPDKKVNNMVQASEWIIQQEEKSNIITHPGKLRQVVKKIKKKKKKIITTNGVFDILHIGHLRYLKECKRLGHVLIIGLNSDKSVHILKGPKRPVINQYARAEMLVNLKGVDYVYIFNEKDPRSFLKIVEPAVHVKAGDYDMKQIIERNIVKKGGGEVKLAGFINGFSSTKIIEKILKNEKKK